MSRRQCREYDTANMNEALVETQKAVECGKMPFGAVLANSDGVIVCRAHNQCEAAARRGGGGVGDVTRHAEMELIRRFTTFLPESERRECTLYTSTEPCVMCAGAIYWSGVRRIVYGCSAAQLEEQVSGPGGFDIPIETLYGLSDATRDKMSVVGPILVDESLELHRNSGVWNKEKATSMPLQKAAEQDIAVEASLLTSGLGSAAVADDGVVPIIDLSIGTPAEVAQKLWEAATQVGFFTIVGHGIDSSITDAAFAASETFFAQSVDDKKQQSPLDMSINCGYEYFNQIRPSTGVADQKESIQITARAGCMEGRWPPNQEFRHATETLLNAAHKLAGRLLDFLEPMATPHVPPGTLSKSHTLWQEDGQCTLRLLHYPSLEAEETEKLLTQGYWRAGPHTDWDNLTLLLQRPGESGLECCANPRTGNPKEMYWTAVNPIEGGIAVNIGDMLARWSDGKLYSNLHRVRLPEDASRPRYSIAFFAQSDKKTLIETKESEPITAGDYILSRIQSNFAK